MPVKCYETEYKNFGRCVCLENSTVKLMASLDFGPRILFYGLRGRENILFEDIDRNFAEPVKEMGTWYSYGGHRIWRAPEVMPETYVPDNIPVEYCFENNILTMKQKVTPFGKRFSLECEMSDTDSTVTVKSTIKNCSDKPSRFAPWAITAFAPDGTEIIPLCTENRGFLPNRVMSLWSYADIYDERMTLSNDSLVLRQDASVKKAIKLGFNVEDAYAAYYLDKQLFVKNFPKYEKVNYPDFLCNLETYTNEFFLECELLGEEREYLPDEEAEIVETWRLFEINEPLGKNENPIEFLKKYI